MTKPYRIDPKSVGNIMFGSVKNILKEKGFVDTLLIKNWQAIMQGVSPAGTCYKSFPVKIARTQKGVTLFLASEDLGFKVDMVYKRQHIIAKANRFLPSNKQIADIKLI